MKTTTHLAAEYLTKGEHGHLLPSPNKAYDHRQALFALRLGNMVTEAIILPLANLNLTKPAGRFIRSLSQLTIMVGHPPRRHG